VPSAHDSDTAAAQATARIPATVRRNEQRARGFLGARQAVIG
jgi:hypothetical protein